MNKEGKKKKGRERRMAEIKEVEEENRRKVSEGRMWGWGGG